MQCVVADHPRWQPIDAAPAQAVGSRDLVSRERLRHIAALSVRLAGHDQA